jgi:hypothetical protein
LAKTLPPGFLGELADASPDRGTALTPRPARISDAAAIAAIYSEGVADRIATFETEPLGQANCSMGIGGLRGRPLRPSAAQPLPVTEPTLKKGRCAPNPITHGEGVER